MIVSIVCLVGARPASAGVQVTDLGGDQFQVRFSYKPDGSVASLVVAGSFNAWSQTATPMVGPDKQGRYTAQVILNAGRYEYKYLVDATQWLADPENPRQRGPFGNSELILGSRTAIPIAQPNDKPVKMIRTGPHPTVIQNWMAELERSQGDLTQEVRDWLSSHPMPMVTDESVSFVYVDASAKSVMVEIFTQGRRSGIPMTRVAASSPVFVLTLQRGDWDNRAAYLLSVANSDTARSLLDPYAWSLTSRIGKPACMIAKPSADRGRIVVHPGVKSDSEALPPRDVYVYLPPGYEQSPKRRYPVLYMHDGQNAWDDPTEPFGHGGWSVNRIADRLIAEGKVQPFIVVAIANTAQRIKEYGPGDDILRADAHPYIKLLVENVRELVQKNYRVQTKPGATGVIGSSMGGSISLQAALLRPDVFGQAACLSPSFLFNDASGLDHLDLVKRVGKQPIRLYVDHGTAGPSNDGADRTRRVVDQLREAGWREGDDLMYFVDQGATHNERAWRSRLDKPLIFMFGRSKEASR